MTDYELVIKPSRRLSALRLKELWVCWDIARALLFVTQY